jgi:hypothetical protein
MFSMEIPGTNGNTLVVQSDGPGQVTVSVLGPRGGELGSAALTERTAAQAATALMHAYQGRWTSTPVRENGTGLPGGSRLTYFDYRKAWFGSSERTIGIAAAVSEAGGGDAWNFEVAEVNLGQYGTALQVRVFDDGFAAFAELPEFFAALAAGGPETLDGVVVLLEDLGAADRTATEPPYPPEADPVEKAAAVIRNHPSGTRDRKQALAVAAAVLAELGLSP